MDHRHSDRLEFEDAEALAVAAAELVAEVIGQAIGDRGEASIVLAGGSTPDKTYRRLAVVPIDWRQVWIFWSDERCVGADDPGSNYAMARSSLLDPAEVPEGRIFRIAGERSAGEAARDYERALRSTFGDRRWPTFDLALLGLGGDGHTASIFSDDFSGPGADEPRTWVRAARGPAPYTERVTLTLGALASARQVVFLVSGGGKAGIVARLLSGAGDDLPAARLVRRAKRVTWLLDADAASGLQS